MEKEPKHDLAGRLAALRTRIAHLVDTSLGKGLLVPLSGEDNKELNASFLVFDRSDQDASLTVRIERPDDPAWAGSALLFRLPEAGGLAFEVVTVAYEDEEIDAIVAYDEALQEVAEALQGKDMTMSEEAVLADIATFMEVYGRHSRALAAIALTEPSEGIDELDIRRQLKSDALQTKLLELLRRHVSNLGLTPQDQGVIAPIIGALPAKYTRNLQARRAGEERYNSGIEEAEQRLSRGESETGTSLQAAVLEVVLDVAERY
jgi:hypothetical protein